MNPKAYETLLKWWGRGKVDAKYWENWNDNSALGLASGRKGLNFPPVKLFRKFSEFFKTLENLNIKKTLKQVFRKFNW